MDTRSCINVFFLRGGAGGARFNSSTCNRKGRGVCLRRAPDRERAPCTRCTRTSGPPGASKAVVYRPTSELWLCLPGSPAGPGRAYTHPRAPHSPPRGLGSAVQPALARPQAWGSNFWPRRRTRCIGADMGSNGVFGSYTSPKTESRGRSRASFAAFFAAAAAAAASAASSSSRTFLLASRAAFFSVRLAKIPSRPSSLVAIAATARGSMALLEEAAVGSARSPPSSTRSSATTTRTTQLHT